MLGPFPAGLVPGAAERCARNPDEIQVAALERAGLIGCVEAAQYAVCHGRPPTALRKGRGARQCLLTWSLHSVTAHSKSHFDEQDGPTNKDASRMEPQIR